MKKYLFLLFCSMPLFLLSQDSISGKLDALMQAYQNVDKFNGSILVAKQGRVLLDKGYGYRNVKEHVKNDTASMYRIYSITKTFTSTVILMLAEQGKLSVKDKLSKYYPGFPKGDSITIEHLLTHTSGIYDYTHGNDMKDQSEPTMIAFLKTKPLDFSPGSNWSYSNSGYWLLGFIIQKITGMTYEEAVTKMIFRPLKMNHSGFDFKDLKSKDKTTPYEFLGKDSSATAVIYDPPGPYAAGAIYSTTHDMYEYHKAHQQYVLVSEPLMKKAYTSFMSDYGYGWVVNQFDGHDLVSHSGGAAGYRSNFARSIKDDIVIIVLCNTESNNPQMITNNILNVLYNKQYNIPVEIAVRQEILQQYAGYYEVDEHFNIHITTEMGKLIGQAKGEGPIVLMAQEDNYFYAEEAGAYLRFNKTKGDQFDEMVIRQGDRTKIAHRYVPAWGMLGSATANGWEGAVPDISLTEDCLHKDYWKAENISLKEGEIKFRFNNNWNTNYGDNENDGNAELSGSNIKVQAGTYDIILDLSDRNRAKYIISKKGLQQ